MTRHLGQLAIGLIAGVVTLAVNVIPAEAVVVYFSTNVADIVSGTNIKSNDIGRYDTESGDFSLFFDGSAHFGRAKGSNIDAFHMFGKNDLLLSTRGNNSLGGVSFADEDLVRYNPATKVASIFFDGSSVFGPSQPNPDVNAAYVFPDGKILLSTRNTATIDGVSFKKQDLVLYNPLTGDASLFFDGNAHFETKKRNIDAVHVLQDGRLVLSTGSTSSKLGGVTFEREDFVIYDPATKKTEFLLHGSDILESTAHLHDKGVDALFVEETVIPEPMTGSLFGMGILLGFFRRRKKHWKLSRA